MELTEIANRLSSRVSALQFSAPISHIYNPLQYAAVPHATYLERYGRGPKDVLLVGMNPGPWGMMQTGIPFGDVGMVRTWLAIDGPVTRPSREHPKRPIAGFSCQRSEVSGTRLWGWAKERFVRPEKFFAKFFVHNYCPLGFLVESGRNFTPDKLPKSDQQALFECCDEALRAMVAALTPKYVIGIGTFAEARAHAALTGIDVTIGRILHPSPASPAANRDWASQADAQLAHILASKASAATRPKARQR